MRETTLLRKVMLCISGMNCKIFRNNVGICKYSSGAMVAYGLCVGSSDLIGFVPHAITPSDVGKKVAVFLAVETKTDDGKVDKAQHSFLNMVANGGGIAIIARGEGSLNELRGLLQPFERGETIGSGLVYGEVSKPRRQTKLAERKSGT